MDDFFSTLLAHPFTAGIALGLVVAAIVWVRGVLKLRAQKKELHALRGHLQTKLEIEATDMERRKKELEDLRQERDNLRNLVQTLNQKPGRPELRQLQVYQRAVDVMFAKSPGFAPVWQMTVAEAEEEVRRAERGVIPFIRRIRGGNATEGTLGLEQNSGK